ncbi:MAG: sulfotransferase [Pseudomonadales bacterium]
MSDQVERPGRADGPSGWIRAALRDAFQALGAGRPQQAAALCRRVLAAAPDLAEAHFLVGLVALELRDRASAVNAFGSVTRLRSDHAAAWAQLARLFLQAGQPNRADRALAQAIEHERGDPVVQDSIGVVCTLLGDHRGACEWYRKACAGAPQHPGFRVNLANSLVFLGDTGAARTELERALAIDPGNAQAHWLLAGARRATDRTHVETMVRVLADTRLPAQAQAFLYYGLGKELEDLEEWPRAFAAFARGAQARRSTLEFDEAAEVAMYEALERIFTRAWLDDGSAAAAPGPDAASGASDAQAPIFVVGQPRTGTTLVERILAAHSQVHSAGELQQFGLSIRRQLDYRQPGRFSAALVEGAAGLDPAALGAAYLQATEKLRGTLPRFVDKLPSNFLYLPLILKALPTARVVHLVRDPMDACFASFKQLFADAYPHSYRQDEMARHFARYHRLMAVWRDRFGDRFLDVRYEALVADLEPNARALIEFVGLPWEDACLQFHSQDSAVATASAVQVREPAHTRSVGRWRRYEAELEPMRRVLLAEGIPV